VAPARSWSQCAKQLLRSHDGVRECGCIQVVRRMHGVMAECGGRIAHQGHVIAQLHGEAGGGLYARVGEQTDGNDMRAASRFLQGPAASNWAFAQLWLG
jgi:hypothetical protein